MGRSRITIALCVVAVAICTTTAALGLDVSAIGKKLIIKDKTSGTDKVVSLQQSSLINTGAAGDASLVSGTFEIQYVDSVNGTVLALPSPWQAATAGAFKFKNELAPGGPSPIKVAKVKSSKLAKVVAKGLGTLDISTPPGANGVITVFTLTNDNDASQLRVCTQYATGLGSTVQHKVTGSGFSLTLKNGVGTACPATCTDGLPNGNETDVDCGGGTCPDCSPGDSCAIGGDCTSGGCASGICQAPSCSDGVQNQAETGVDCGGPCAGCGFNGGCIISGDCAGGLVCSSGLCKCPNTLFTFTVNSDAGGPFTAAKWPSGTVFQTGAAGCSVAINRPDDDVDLVCSLADPFSVNSFTGFSACFGTGGEDGDGCQVNSCPPLGIGSCCMGRPSCSTALNGSASSSYFVQCLQ